MKTKAVIEMAKDGRFGIYTPDLKTTKIIGSGSTVAEAKADFENSVVEMFDCYMETNGGLPDELNGVEFVYKYDIASFLEYYKFINVSQLAKVLGINPSLMRQYKKGQHISEKRVKKIQEVINSVGKELAEIEFI